MKATIKDGSIQISLHELTDCMNDEDRAVLFQFAVYQEKLLQAVVETVAEGSAFNADWSIGGLPQKLREQLLPLLPTAVTELVRGLKNDIARLEKRQEFVQSALWKLQRAWPATVPPMPEGHESYDYKPLTPAEAEAFLNRELGGVWHDIKAAHTGDVVS